MSEDAVANIRITATDDTTAAIKNLRDEIAKLDAAMAKLGKHSGQSKVYAQEEYAEVRRIGQARMRLATGLHDLTVGLQARQERAREEAERRRVVEEQRATREAAIAERRAARAAANQRTQSERMASALGGVATRWISVAAAVSAAHQAYMGFAENEEQMRVIGVRVGATQERIAKLDETIKKTARDTGISENEMIASFEALREAGYLTIEQVQEIGPAMAETARRFGLSTVEMAQSLGAFMQTFQISVERGPQALALLRTAATQLRLDLGQLNRLGPQLAEQMEEMGVSGEEGLQKLLVMLGTLKPAFGDTTRTARALTQVLGQMRQGGGLARALNMNEEGWSRMMASAEARGQDLTQVYFKWIEIALKRGATWERMFNNPQQRRAIRMLFEQRNQMQKGEEKLREESTKSADVMAKNSESAGTQVKKLVVSLTQVGERLAALAHSQGVGNLLEQLTNVLNKVDAILAGLEKIPDVPWLLTPRATDAYVVPMSKRMQRRYAAEGASLGTPDAHIIPPAPPAPYVPWVDRPRAPAGPYVPWSERPKPMGYTPEEGVTRHGGGRYGVFSRGGGGVPVQRASYTVDQEGNRTEQEATRLLAEIRDTLRKIEEEGAGEGGGEGGGTPAAPSEGGGGASAGGGGMGRRRRGGLGRPGGGFNQPDAHVITPGGGDGGGPGVADAGAVPKDKAERIARAKAAMQDQLRKEGVPEGNIEEASNLLAGQALEESGLNPNAVHDAGTGYGIYGARLPRRAAMLAWLAKNGYPRNSLEGQSRYMAHEAMSGRYPASRRALMGATAKNRDESMFTLTREFEAPKVQTRIRTRSAIQASRIPARRNAPMQPAAKTAAPAGASMSTTPGAPAPGMLPSAFPEPPPVGSFTPGGGGPERLRIDVNPGPQSGLEDARRMRAELSQPIMIRAQMDRGPDAQFRRSTIRRQVEGEMREARNNSYSDIGVA